MFRRGGGGGGGGGGGWGGGLICAFVVCILKSFSRNWVKKRSCKFKYTQTVKVRLFRPFFLI